METGGLHQVGQRRGEAGSEAETRKRGSGAESGDSFLERSAGKRARSTRRRGWPNGQAAGERQAEASLERAGESNPEELLKSVRHLYRFQGPNVPGS